MNVSMNSSTSNFSCLALENLSSFDITDPKFWRIQDGLQGAAPVLAAFYTIAFAVAFAWNLFIVITYLVKYKLLKEPGNLFLFNLAFSDLLVAVTVMMFSFVAQAGGEFIFGYTDVVRCHLCDFVGFFTILLIFSTFLLLAALSIDRFILLAYPLRYKRLMSFWKAVVVLIILWLVSFTIAILPIIGFGQYEFNNQYGSCIPRFTGNGRFGIPNINYYVFGVLVALVPILIMAFTNVFTYRLVSRFLKRNLKRRKTFRSAEEHESNAEEDRRHRQQQNQLVRVFGALCIANCVAWTPVICVVLAVGIVGFIMMSTTGVANEVPGGVYVFGWICFLTNPVVHPIIESLFVKDLRYQVRRARKTLRRASTAVFRTLTRNQFDSSDLEKANQAVDAGAPSSKRTILFLSKSKQNERMKQKEMDSSVINTEEYVMDEMSTAPSNSPTPEPNRREIVKIGKVGRSVTFTDSTTVSPTSSEGVTLKSVLKRHSEPGAIRLEVNEVFHEEDESANQSEPSTDVLLPSNGVNGIHIVGGGVQVETESGRESAVVECEDLQPIALGDIQADSGTTVTANELNGTEFSSTNHTYRSESLV